MGTTRSAPSRIAGCAALAVGTVVVYWGTQRVPFILDDMVSIVDNPSIRRLGALGLVLRPPDYAGDGGRPLVNLSYALNYAAGGTAVAGYHAVNLAIHILAAWVLFGVVRRTLLRPGMAERFGAAATPLAFAISALWAWHPAQTEAVTYVTQRCEALMGLFYLLTLYGFIRGVEAAGAGARRGWFAVAVAACLAGVGTKEVIVTAPVVVCLYDRTFVSGSFGAAWRRHRGFLIALAATWVPLAFLMTGLRHRGVGFEQGVSWWAYGFEESRAIAIYLARSVWPHPLVLDYGMFQMPGLAAVLPCLVLVAVVLTIAIIALVRWPKPGFAAGWFLLILAPTSSVVPLAGQPIADHRLYLPLAGVTALAVLAGYRWLGGRVWAASAAVAVAFGIVTVERNRDFRSERSIWEKTVAQVPDNPRAHNNLGAVLARMPGRTSEAIAEYETAIRLKPDYAEAHANLGVAFHDLPGQQAEAIREFEAAVRLKPGYATAHNYLGAALTVEPGQLERAITELTTAVTLQPDYAEAHNNLGNARMAQPGGAGAAIAEFETAIRLKPDFADAHFNLGNVLSHVPGRKEEATAELREAMSLKPTDADAHYNLGVLFGRLPGREADAIAEYQAAIRLRPGFVKAHNNLGNAWLRDPAHLSEAIAEFRETLRLDPNEAAAHYNLAVALLRTPGGAAEAVSHLEAYSRLRPGDDRARQLLQRLGVLPPP